MLLKRSKNMLQFQMFDLKKQGCASQHIYLLFISRNSIAVRFYFNLWKFKKELAFIRRQI